MQPSYDYGINAVPQPPPSARDGHAMDDGDDDGAASVTSLGLTLESLLAAYPMQLDVAALKGM